jgi:hypothetical protein
MKCGLACKVWFIFFEKYLYFQSGGIMVKGCIE